LNALALGETDMKGKVEGMGATEVKLMEVKLM
jgi:hypothetical protein